MSLHLSPPCFPTLGALYACLPLVSHSGCLGPHEFTLVSPLSPTLGALGRMSLHLSRTLVSHSGFLGPHEFTLRLVSPLSPPLWVGRMSLHLCPTCLPHLSPTLGSLGCMSLHLSPPCLPLVSPLSSPCLPLVSHSGCLVPHEFTLVSHLFPALVSHTCLPLWVPWAA